MAKKYSARAHQAGKRIALIRELEGIRARGKKYTQADLAKIANLSLTKIKSWETGEYMVSGEEAYRISKAFRWPMSWIVVGDPGELTTEQANEVAGRSDALQNT